MTSPCLVAVATKTKFRLSGRVADKLKELDATYTLASNRLAELAPLEAVTVFPRPTLFVQGAVDSLLPAAHKEAWRAALAATGRTADGIEARNRRR